MTDQPTPTVGARIRVTSVHTSGARLIAEDVVVPLDESNIGAYAQFATGGPTWLPSEEDGWTNTVEEIKPAPELVRLERGPYLDKDGQLCMADDDGWLMYMGSEDTVSPAVAAGYGPFTRLVPATDVVSIDLAVDVTAMPRLVVEIIDEGNFPLPGTMHEARDLIARAEAATGGGR